MKRILTLCLLSLALIAPASAVVSISFNPNENQWQLVNEVLMSSFTLTSDGLFQLDQITSTATGDTWQKPDSIGSSPIRFTADGIVYDAGTSYQLVQEYQENAAAGGQRQVIVLQDLSGTVRVRLSIEIFPFRPVLRYSVDVSNLGNSRMYIQNADMLPWRFGDRSDTFQWFRVNQWAIVPQQQNFEPSQLPLDRGGAALTIQSGARGQQCSWWALSDSKQRGLFAGWEFDGLATATVRHSGDNGFVETSATVEELNHPIEPGETFHVPGAFIGVYHGDWDEAGYRTQRFVEKVLAAPMPDDRKFPYAAWDSWGYNEQFDEDLLRRNAEVASKLGFELFIVDLGWARGIGDWYADPDKFPNGLRAFSDYVHSLGMKFGLHLALAEAMPESPVLMSNPDWATSEDYFYFGSKSLCLSNKETRDWVIANTVRVIRDYNVDWILQDGENMVKKCTKTTHSHDPNDSNYANAVDGLDYVLQEVQRQTPGTVWENCEDGGNMMTFNMVKNYVTSITNDANGALGARKAVFGATYPFPPRYADRYMPDGALDTYTTRSFVFGGPWVQMNRLADLSSSDQDFLGREVQVFKYIRTTVRDGKVFHQAAPGELLTDAIQSYNQTSDTGVAVVTRNNAQADHYDLFPSGLNPDGTYTVSFQDDNRIELLSGADLMSSGVRVSLPASKSSEVVYIQPK
jgi:alpha-galactosidase